jgi:ElaB/YqjD/DUF883 family membrane-anchored ribosome-binding protein
MAQDEAVAKLLKFNDDVGRSSSQLGESSSGLEETVEDFGRLESEAEELISGLASDVQDAVRELGTAADDARDSLQALTEEAEAVETDRLADARDGLEDAVSDLRDRVEAAGEDLQAGFDRLAEAGFQSYAEALDETQSATTEAGEANEESFAALDRTLEEASGRADAMRSEGGEALGTAATEAEEEGATLETAFTEATSQWDQTVDEQLRAGCEDVGSTLDALYEGWTEQAGSVAEELATSVRDAMQAVAEAVGTGAVDAVSEAALEAQDEAGGALRDELDADAAALESGEELARALEPLTPELQTCTTVVAEIDRLLDQLG